MKKILLLFTVAILTLFIAACGEKTTTTDKSGRLSIYTTVYPLSYFTERIGGDFVDVSSIYPPGANEHTFEPTQKNMMQLADADLFFYVGLGLEGFVENAKKTLAKEDVTLVATADNVTEEQLAISTGATHDEEEGHHEDHDHGDIDPHVWLSPIISQDLALSIKDALVEKMPEQEEAFTANYETLINELQQLDEQFKSMATATNDKTFFVSHAAFGYIAGEYGLNQISIAGLNTQTEPSQKELTAIVDKAKDLHIQYILFEQNVSSKLAEVIQKEVGADSLILHNLSTVTTADIKNKETYFTLMQKNIKTLETALNTQSH